MRAPGQVLGAPSVFKLVPRAPQMMENYTTYHDHQEKKHNFHQNHCGSKDISATTSPQGGPWNGARLPMT